MESDHVITGDNDAKSVDNNSKNLIKACEGLVRVCKGTGESCCYQYYFSSIFSINAQLIKIKYFIPKSLHKYITNI